MNKSAAILDKIFNVVEKENNDFNLSTLDNHIHKYLNTVLRNVKSKNQKIMERQIVLWPIKHDERDEVKLLLTNKLDQLWNELKTYLLDIEDKYYVADGSGGKVLDGANGQFDFNTKIGVGLYGVDLDEI